MQGCQYENVVSISRLQCNEQRLYYSNENQEVVTTIPFVKIKTFLQTPLDLNQGQKNLLRSSLLSI